MANWKKELEMMLEEIDSNQITVEPHWVLETTIEDLDAAGVGIFHHYENDSYTRQQWYFLRKGMVLIAVDFSRLLPVLHPEYRKELEDGEFINWQALQIIKEWRGGMKLTAPFCALTHDQNKIQIFVGNHRINTALRIGAKSIFLLIPKAQLSVFQKLLGTFSVYEQSAIVFDK
ncbi:MAG TPA: hypothetical protein VFO93_15255 [Hymenobacter sp.]|uniref:hypothetical protein n=1 Tax=Hymenobacter sp. TaxID=1898978 RepID=UPI002D7E28C1|nr:hypothetical protein [Hymenobacter sp.]HET9504898.1 hypothetical protein [Hymenobacter sp.]